VHAVAFLPLLILKRNRRFAGAVVAEDRMWPSMNEMSGMVATFAVVMLGWTFFRADNLSQAWQWLDVMLFRFDFRLSPLMRQGMPHAFAWAVVMLICEWFNRRKQYGFAIYPPNAILRYAVYFVLLFVIVFNISPRQTFIYFQF
jgi:hypothetical protein